MQPMMTVQIQRSLSKQITSIHTSKAENRRRKCIWFLFMPLLEFMAREKITLWTFLYIFFRRKRLFKFDKTSQTILDGSKEHRRNASDVSNDEVLSALQQDKNKGVKSLVCQPDATLIRKIYLPLMNYTREIEEMIKTKPSQSSAFNEFLNAHIKNVFLNKGHKRNLELIIESLAKNHDAWRAIISPEEMKSLGLSRPLLQSTVLVEQSKWKMRFFLIFLVQLGNFTICFIVFMLLCTFRNHGNQ